VRGEAADLEPRDERLEHRLLPPLRVLAHGDIRAAHRHGAHGGERRACRVAVGRRPFGNVARGRRRQRVAAVEHAAAAAALAAVAALAAAAAASSSSAAAAAAAACGGRARSPRLVELLSMRCEAIGASAEGRLCSRAELQQPSSRAAAQPS